jgi:hypothetical protein
MRRSPDSLHIVVEEEKLRERIHPCGFSLARCHARCCSHALRKGKKGPQLPFLASWREATPASFDATPVGTYPHRRRLFLDAIFDAAALPKAVDWLPVPSQQQIA